MYKGVIEAITVLQTHCSVTWKMKNGMKAADRALHKRNILQYFGQSGKDRM